MRHFFLHRRPPGGLPPTTPGTGWEVREAGRLTAGWRGQYDGDPDAAFARLDLDVEARRATITADRFGLYPVYHARNGEASAWATSPVVLASLLGMKPEVCPRAAEEMLILHMPLGDRCLLAGARCSPPASVIHVSEDGERAEEYWRWQGLEEAPGDEASLVRPTFALIEAAVMRAVPAGVRKVALPLSGGLDSRMLAAVLAKNGVPVRAYNIDFGREAELARRVAAELGIPITGMPMLEHPERLAEAHAEVGGAYHFNQMWGAEMARRAAEDGCDVLFDGLAFDTILGGVFQAGADGAAELARTLESNFCDVSEGALRRLWPERAAEVFASLRRSLLEEAEAAVARAGVRASEHFVMRNRIRKYTFGYCLANLSHLPGRFPYVTGELFDHCLRLPLALRHQHRLYRRIYVEMFPGLARIPWAKTGLPLDRYAPLERSRWWHLADTALRRLSWGRLTLDGRGSFDHLARANPRVRAVYSHLLSLPWGLPESVAARAAAEHFSGRSNLGGLLQGAATVKHFQHLLRESVA
jgi:hypothetical protein